MAHLTTISTQKVCVLSVKGGTSCSQDDVLLNVMARTLKRMVWALILKHLEGLVCSLALIGMCALKEVSATCWQGTSVH